ncbi:MAG: hypothetical protein ACERKO_12260, partial [Acetanaerobacterium sp.]
MLETITIVVFTVLSVFGVFFVFELAARYLMSRGDSGTTVKIIRMRASELEYAVRAAESRLACAWHPQQIIILVVFGDSDPEAREIGMRLSEEYDNILLCSEQLLPQEIVR